jgi:hypothetical protein
MDACDQRACVLYGQFKLKLVKGPFSFLSNFQVPIPPSDGGFPLVV